MTYILFICQYKNWLLTKQLAGLSLHHHPESKLK
jgi:hypothetical protein